MRVLLIKLSSMGDVIHTLPALTDAAAFCEDIQFDWLVEKSFTEIPRWHPAVNRVIPWELRHWRKNLWQSKTWQAINTTLETLREVDYDLIIDAQGLLKSALPGLIAKGKTHGLNFQSAREGLAALFYHKRHAVAKGQHAVERIRQLFAQALDYTLPSSPADYGLQTHFSNKKPQKPYLVFLTNTTWATKHWPVAYWQTLTRQAVEAGYEVHFTSGNTQEWRHILAIAQNIPKTVLYPRQSIAAVAKLLGGAAGVISVDTGFAHLAAALAKPCVSLFGPTNPVLTKPYGPNQIALAADFECAPCMQKSCTHKERNADISPPCFQQITPKKVWENLKAAIKT